MSGNVRVELGTKVEDQDLATRSQLDRINGLVGLSQIKAELNDLIARLRLEQHHRGEAMMATGMIQQMVLPIKAELDKLIARLRPKQHREAEGMKLAGLIEHMVFTGPPGVGKTIAGETVAIIYRGLGVLKGGQCVGADRTDFVAGYIGQTERKTLDVCNSAIGGVLFVEEPYSFAGDGSVHDFGQRAIDTLTEFMREHRGQLLVILAGEADPMHRFLDSNPGLARNFSKTIDFPSFSGSEMCEILASLGRQQGFSLPAGFEAKVAPWVESQRSSPDWANARMMRNLVERMREAQGDRLARDPDSGAFDALNMSDLDVALTGIKALRR
jgi:stage V sporulation protein K